MKSVDVAYRLFLCILLASVFSHISSNPLSSNLEILSDPLRSDLIDKWVPNSDVQIPSTLSGDAFSVFAQDEEDDNDDEADEEDDNDDEADEGVEIFSTYNGTGYAVDSGTSMAAPHVSGAAALYKLQNPDAGPAEVKAHILSRGSLPSTTCEGGPSGYFTGDPDTVPEPLMLEQIVSTSSYFN